MADSRAVDSSLKMAVVGWGDGENQLLSIAPESAKDG